MKKRVLKKIQIIVWILGVIAIGLLIYGIARILLS
jgi:hypothetical protein